MFRLLGSQFDASSKQPQMPPPPPPAFQAGHHLAFGPRQHQQVGTGTSFSSSNVPRQAPTDTCFGAKLRQFLGNGADPGTAGGLSLAIGGAGGGGGHWPPHPLLHGWGNGGGTSWPLPLHPPPPSNAAAAATAAAASSRFPPYVTTQGPPGWVQQNGFHSLARPT